MRLLFLFIGEPHHLFHALPIAAEISTLAPDISIEIALSSAAQRPIMDQILAAYPGFAPTVRMLGQRGPARWLQSLGLVHHPRIPLLIGALPYLHGFDAIMVPERTTTAIRHFLPRRTQLLFTPHGAGDRAIMLDPRDRHFDFVLVAGKKSEQRLLDAGTIRPGHYAVNGYVKMDLMARMESRRAPLFDNDRPTVLYAPHFRRSLSSWDKFGRDVIAYFASQDRFNLVVAPHVRLFSEATPGEIAQITDLAIPGKIHIDLVSDRLFDMTYTEGADIYLGDVSSQVYEFLRVPKPCIFLNAHDVAWRDDPDYRFWTLGRVISTLGDLADALGSAALDHPHYAALQQALLAESIGGDPRGAARRGAEAVISFLASAPRPATCDSP